MQIDKHETPPTATPPAPATRPAQGPRLRVLVIGAVVIVLAMMVGVIAAPILRPMTVKAWQGLISWVSTEASDDANTADAAGSESGEGTTWYISGMHPWVIQPKPGNCPICGMKLTPLDPAAMTGKLAIDPVVVQNIGVRIAPVTRARMEQTIIAPGIVAKDESRIRDVIVRVPGQIEVLHANTLSMPIQQGQALAEFYSPEVLAAGYELSAARELRQPEALAAAQSKLTVMGVPDDFVQGVIASGKVPNTFALRSPIDGILMSKGGDQGHWLERGSHLAEIVDLSNVWVMVTLYEHQMGWVKVGQKATIDLPYQPGVSFEGLVTTIYPTLDAELRQVTVRLEATNPSASEPVLKPGMFTQVHLQRISKDEVLLVPREAVLDSGRQQTVLVSVGEGRFETRSVQLGEPAQNGLVEVREGLQVGENVVVSGQFLLDSEARKREALLKMIKGTPAVATPEPMRPVEQGEMQKMSSPAAQALTVMLRHYLAITAALAADDDKPIITTACSLADATRAWVNQMQASDEHFQHRFPQVERLIKTATELGAATTIAQQREQLAHTSAALAAVLKSFGVPGELGQPLEMVRCPMVTLKTPVMNPPIPGAGASWIQPAGVVRNPYFGAAMLSCFDQRQPLPMARF